MKRLLSAPIAAVTLVAPEIAVYRKTIVTMFLLFAAVLSLPGSVMAVITPTSSALSLATAAFQNPALITGASFDALPPFGMPNAVSDTALASFPTDGSDYAILTTGDATLADDPNTSESSGADDGGGNVRGGSNWDVTILKIDIAVPNGANCLSIGFRFLSEEYPEFVGTPFNDAFIAELDSSTWMADGSVITAPDNFAFDQFGNEISVNAAGAASMSAAEAAGTTYDGATPLLSASTPVTAGAHTLYLSIFDQGDRLLDSAVFLDGIVIGTTGPGGCVPGATVLSTMKTADSPSSPPGGMNGYTITVNNPGSTAVTVSQITDTLPAGFTYVPGSTSGATTAGPLIASQMLTWAGPFAVPAMSSVSLHFNVVVSTTPGQYFNDAGAESPDAPVTPTGPTAPITVTEGTTTTTTTTLTTTTTPTTTTTTLCAPQPENDEEACSNMQDDDCDGMIDCADPDCNTIFPCPRAKKDPTLIKFGRAGLDLLRSQARLDMTPVDITAMRGVAMVLSNPQAVIYSGQLATGALTNRGGTFLFRNPDARTSGGVYGLKIRQIRTGYKFSFASYANLSAATDPNMRLQFYMGTDADAAPDGRIFITNDAPWKRIPSGWRAPKDH